MNYNDMTVDGFMGLPFGAQMRCLKTADELDAELAAPSIRLDPTWLEFQCHGIAPRDFVRSEWTEEFIRRRDAYSMEARKAMYYRVRAKLEQQRAEQERKRRRQQEREALRKQEREQAKRRRQEYMQELREEREEHRRIVAEIREQEEWAREVLASKDHPPRTTITAEQVAQAISNVESWARTWSNTEPKDTK